MAILQMENNNDGRAATVTCRGPSDRMEGKAARREVAGKGLVQFCEHLAGRVR